MKMQWMLPYVSVVLFAAAGCSAPSTAVDGAEPAAVEASATDDAAAVAPAAAEPTTGNAQAAQSGQAAPAPRPRMTPPVRGVANLAYTKPVVKAGKIEGQDFIITTFQVKNMATGSIAGFKVDEFWYDKAGDPVTGDSFRHPKPLQPGEVITVTLETPRNPKMNSNRYNFSHANGEIKPTLQAKL